MVLLEVELLPMVMGFSIGTVIFIFQRFSAGRGGQPSEKIEEGSGDWEVEQPLSPSSLEPEPEEEQSPAGEQPAAGRQRLGKARIVALVALVLVLFTVWVFPAAPGSGPAPACLELGAAPALEVERLTASEEPNAVQGPAADAEPQAVVEPEAALPTGSEEPEVVQGPAVDAEPQAVTEPEVEQPAGSEEPTAAQGPASDEEPQTVVEPEAPAVEAEDVAAETAAAQDEPQAAEEQQQQPEEEEGEEKEEEEEEEEEEAEVIDDSQVLSLNLSRQQMAFKIVGGMVHYKSAYWGTITLGSPAQDYKVVFDTGSGHLILPSAFCHSETCRAHKRYRRSKSSTAVDINYDGTTVNKGDPRDQITVSFGTGEVTGVFVEDRLCLHGLDKAGAGRFWDGCMPMRMILATKMSEEPFKTFHFDGVLGLGLSGLSQAPEFNIAHMMAAALTTYGGPKPNMFSVFLAEHEAEGSEISFGGYARKRFQGKLRWNPVLEPEHGHWMLEIKSVRIDDEVLRYCDEGCRAVVDTGTSLLAVPKPAFPEIFDMLRHEADPMLECDGEGPKLHIELQDFTVTLKPHDYAKPESQLHGRKQENVAPIFPMTALNGSAIPGFVAPPREICKPMLMSMVLPPPVGPKVFVLGEPVLRKYYTVYDSQEPNPRIGFARAVHDSADDA